MNDHAGVKTEPRPTASPLARWLGVVFALLIVASSGCTRLRLPAIDPTGTRIFAPLPQTTSIALPGSAGEGVGCLRNLGSRLRAPNFQLPTPAFEDPAEPPECLTPTAPPTLTTPPSSVALGATEPCVPGEQCPDSCKAGPPAVLFGRECQMRDCLKLPKRGKRGCILLSPQKIVAPVGGEVVLLSGICGDDGYLQVAEPLEWMLTPDSVGTFIQVGDDDPGLLHRLARVKKASKKDASFARGVTSSKRTLITRGNLDPQDDVQLEKGQTWITLSSPSEGTSRVTVLAPESDCWDHRKATATIYWVDARSQYPSSQIVAADTPVFLKTRVTRSEGRLAAAGWRVRYEVLDPSLALFDNGSAVVEVPVDGDGNAIAQLIPVKGKAGITPVDIQVIRPGGVSDTIPTLTLSRGQTFVTWSAPQLSIEAGAPPVATFGVPIDVAAVVKNAGDQPATNVRVVMGIPPTAKASSRDGFAQNTPRAIEWLIPSILPQTQVDLLAEVTAQEPMRVTFEARGDSNLLDSAYVDIDVYRPSLMLSVEPERDRYETGEPVTFKVIVENTGDRALEDVDLKAVGDGSMVHNQGSGQGVGKKKEGPLQPGEKWPVQVTFIPTDSGRRCVNFSVTASAGQLAQRESCVTVINPVPPTPAISVKLERRQNIVVGNPPVVLRGSVTNTGEVPLTDVRVTMTHDPQLQLLGATEQGLDQSRLGQYLIAWDIPTLAPDESRLLEAEMRPLSINPRSQVVMTARTKEGATSNDSYTVEIEQGRAPEVGPPPTTTPRTSPPSSSDRNPGGSGSSLPPVQPAPVIPAPIPNITDSAGGAGPSGAGPGRSTDRIPRTDTQPPRRDLPLPNAGTGTGLRTTLAALDNPGSVGRPIRYRLEVVNDSAVADSQVSLRFALPPGVSLKGVSQTTNPELSPPRNNGNIVELPDIRSMRPGERVYFEIELRSNQPQTFDLIVEAASQNSGGNIVRTQTRTTVLP